MIDFNKHGEPFIVESMLKLIPQVLEMNKKNPAMAKANLMYIACMVSYGSPWLTRFRDFNERKKAVLSAYSKRRIGASYMTADEVEKDYVKEAMAGFKECQKDELWEYYYILQGKIDECDKELGAKNVSSDNVESQSKIMKLRKETYNEFLEVRKQIFSRLSSGDGGAGAKAHQLSDIQLTSTK